MAPIQCLDRRDRSAAHLGKRDEAGVHCFTADQDGAGAALSFAAAFLGSRQAALLAQNVQESLHRVRRDVDSLSVEPKPHGTLDLEARVSEFEMEERIRSGVAGISRTSIPRCRMALTIAGAGPSIGISPTPLAPWGPCL